MRINEKTVISRQKKLKYKRIRKLGKNKPIESPMTPSKINSQRTIFNQFPARLRHPNGTCIPHLISRIRRVEPTATNAREKNLQILQSPNFEKKTFK